MRIRALGAASLPLALLLSLATHTQQAQGQEDCFNDDHRLSRNDLEPPSAPIPALTVSAQDLASVLASIAEHERRRGVRAQVGAEDNVHNRAQGSAQSGPIKP